MLILEVILYTFLIHSVTCRLQVIDPVFPKYTHHDFNLSRMFSSASPLIQQEQCKPVRAWILARHGEKYPGHETIDNITNKLIPEIQELIVDVYSDEENLNKLNYSQQQYIDGIKKWKNVLTGGSHKDLTESGKKTMVDLGKRLNSKLKGLMKVINKDEIEVVSAVEDRCLISGKKLIRGLYEGDHDDIDINRTLEETDRRLKLMKPSDSSTKVADPDNPGKLIYIEDLYFKQNAWRITQNVRIRLFPDGVGGDKLDELRQKVTDDLVKIMYDSCVHGRFHFGEDGTNGGAWCSVFTYEDFRFFEDMSDMNYFFRNGYHVGEIEKVGNPIIKDLLEFLIEPKDLKLKIFMGHTSNCMSIITRFNMFNDKDNIINKMEDRKWRSSFMTPSGCNVMFVVYDCGYKTLKVSFYLNEMPIKMNWNGEYECEKCNLDDFIELLSSFNLSEKPAMEKPTKADEEKKYNKFRTLEKKKTIKEEKINDKQRKIEDTRIAQARDDERITFEVYPKVKGVQLKKKSPIT